MAFLRFSKKISTLKKSGETKTLIIVHDVPSIFCDIRKKKNRARKPSKKLLTGFGEAYC